MCSANIFAACTSSPKGQIEMITTNDHHTNPNLAREKLKFVCVNELRYPNVTRVEIKGHLYVIFWTEDGRKITALNSSVVISEPADSSDL